MKKKIILITIATVLTVGIATPFVVGECVKQDKLAQAQAKYDECKKPAIEYADKISKEAEEKKPELEKKIKEAEEKKEKATGFNKGYYEGTITGCKKKIELYDESIEKMNKQIETMDNAFKEEKKKYEDILGIMYLFNDQIINTTACEETISNLLNQGKKEILDRQSQVYKEQSESVKKQSEEMSNSIKEQSDAISKSGKEQSDAISKSIKEQTDAMTNSMKK